MTAPAQSAKFLLIHQLPEYLEDTRAKFPGTARKFQQAAFNPASGFGYQFAFREIIDESDLSRLRKKYPQIDVEFKQLWYDRQRSHFREFVLMERLEQWERHDSGAVAQATSLIFGRLNPTAAVIGLLACGLGAMLTRPGSGTPSVDISFGQLRELFPEISGKTVTEWKNLIAVFLLGQQITDQTLLDDRSADIVFLLGNLFAMTQSLSTQQHPPDRQVAEAEKFAQNGEHKKFCRILEAAITALETAARAHAVDSPVVQNLFVKVTRLEELKQLHHMNCSVSAAN